jgi:hypothetical protein
MCEPRGRYSSVDRSGPRSEEAGSEGNEKMMVQIIAGLFSAALVASGLAILLAGRSIFIAARFVLGWLAALVAAILALATAAAIAFDYLANHIERPISCFGRCKHLGSLRNFHRRLARHETTPRRHSELAEPRRSERAEPCE